MAPSQPQSLLSSLPTRIVPRPPLPAPPPARRWSGLRARIADLRSSAWAPVAARMAAVVLALLVLGWIGRSAAAGPGGGPMGALGVALADGGAMTASASESADGSAPSAAAAAPESPPPPVTLPGPPLAPTANGGPSTASRARATPEDPVYLNHASVDELRRLPGVGAKRAEAILVLRQRVGRFQRVEDLLRVKGVGRGAVKKWRPLVRLDAPVAPDGGSP